MRRDLSVPTPEADHEARLSIGALATATGIPVETLRTWESRYAFPTPDRRPSGHRVYSAALIPRLRRIAEALARGHRAGHAVTASDAQLAQLLSVTPAARRDTSREPLAASLPAIFEAVRTFDADRLTRMLLSESARRGAVEFLEQCIAPLLTELGQAWERRELTISHEHYASERVGDLLRTLRLPFEDRARGPLVVFSTLPGEVHGLGLQMAALVAAEAGCRVLFLGTEVPVAQIASLSQDIGAAAVAVSVSARHRTPAMRSSVAQLRKKLPSHVHLVLGGAGAPQTVKNTALVASFADLRRWAARLAA